MACHTANPLPRVGGGGVLPYISHMGMCRPKGHGVAPFWSQNRYRLCSFWSGIGYGLQDELGECTNVFIVSFQMNKKEREICEFEMNFKK